MTEFEQIALAHRERYPLMRPRDFGKLAYQSEFGPEHMVTNEREIAAYILREWQAVSANAVPCNPEPIGNGICRLHLARETSSQEAAAALAELFMQSAREHTGTPEGLQKRLEILSRLPVSGMGAWLEAYRLQGCPPVHHSEEFRAAYQPHYRILLTPLANRFRAAFP